MPIEHSLNRNMDSGLLGAWGRERNDIWIRSSHCQHRVRSSHSRLESIWPVDFSCCVRGPGTLVLIWHIHNSWPKKNGFLCLATFAGFGGECTRPFDSLYNAELSPFGHRRGKVIWNVLNCCKNPVRISNYHDYGPHSGLGPIWIIAQFEFVGKKRKRRFILNLFHSFFEFSVFSS